MMSINCLNTFIHGRSSSGGNEVSCSCWELTCQNCFVTRVGEEKEKKDVSVVRASSGASPASCGPLHLLSVPIMLRAKHGGIALYSYLLKTACCECFLHSSPFSPTPKTAAIHPSSLTRQSPQVSASNAVSSSAASSISSLLSAQTVQCKDFDDLLKDYKDKLNSKLVLQILMNYKQLGRVKTLEFFSWAGIQMGFQFDDCVIEYMADFLGRRKLFDDIKYLLLTTLSHKGALSCRVFSICIRFLGRQGKVAEALSLFQEMETTFRCKPDNIVCNNILYVLCKKETSGKLIDVALTIFHGIDFPDTYSYSNMLVGLCKFGRFGTALEVFDKMDRAGLVPTRSAVNVLIGKLCLLSAKEGVTEKVRVKNVSRPFTILVPNVSSKKGAIEPAVSVFWKVCDLGLLPSAFVIVQLMSELCRLGKMEEALKILNFVEQRKMSCLEKGYSVLVQALCEHNWVKEASFLFGRMLSLAVKPKLAVYNSIICMLSKAGCLDDAERVFKIMNKKRCLPDNVTYTALVHAYIEAMNWEAAYDLLIEMLGLGLIPNFHTFNLMDKLLRENGQMDLCFKVEGKLETQILLRHCKIGQLEAAYQKLNSMIEKGFHPALYVCDAFQQAFQRYGCPIPVRLEGEIRGKPDHAKKIKCAFVWLCFIRDRNEEQVQLNHQKLLLENDGAKTETIFWTGPAQLSSDGRRIEDIRGGDGPDRPAQNRVRTDLWPPLEDMYKLDGTTWGH
ncbi:hypothetical protein DITRI_Ditri12bG0190600 [Diplodiscus trichospermus]